MLVVGNVGAAKVPLHTQWLRIVEEGKFCFLKSTALPAPIFLTAAEVWVAKLFVMVEGCSIHDMGHLANHYDVCPQNELAKA